MARSLYDAAVLTTVVGWFYREGYRQQRPVDFGDNDKRICEVAEAVQVAREKLRDADARWTDLPREDLDNFMDGVVDDEDRESMTLVVCPRNDLAVARVWPNGSSNADFGPNRRNASKIKRQLVQGTHH